MKVDSVVLDKYSLPLPPPPSWDLILVPPTPLSPLSPPQARIGDSVAIDDECNQPNKQQRKTIDVWLLCDNQCNQQQCKTVDVWLLCDNECNQPNQQQHKTIDVWLLCDNECNQPNQQKCETIDVWLLCDNERNQQKCKTVDAWLLCDNECNQPNQQQCKTIDVWLLCDNEYNQPNQQQCETTDVWLLCDNECNQPNKQQCKSIDVWLLCDNECNQPNKQLCKSIDERLLRDLADDLPRGRGPGITCGRRAWDGACGEPPDDRPYQRRHRGLSPPSFAGPHQNGRHRGHFLNVCSGPGPFFSRWASPQCQKGPRSFGASAFQALSTIVG